MSLVDASEACQAENTSFLKIFSAPIFSKSVHMGTVFFFANTLAFPISTPYAYMYQEEQQHLNKEKLMTGTANEKFNTTNIRTAALKLLSSQLTETTVNFSVERESKRFAINATPTNSNDEFVVSLELRVKGFDNLKFNMLDALALAELQERATNAVELEKRDARIAELEALLSAK